MIFNIGDRVMLSDYRIKKIDHNNIVTGVISDIEFINAPNLAYLIRFDSDNPRHGWSGWFAANEVSLNKTYYRDLKLKELDV